MVQIINRIVPGSPEHEPPDSVGDRTFEATIVDQLPDGPSGGMCDVTPQIQNAQVFASDGVTPVPGKGPLVEGVDYTFSYAGTPTCQMTLTMLSPQASISGP